MGMNEWGREDSNLRRLSRRVYSPFPLAARAHPHGERHCSFGPVSSFDVAVVGAGPAGSTAAYRLASAGARVLLVDKAVFPRDKPCGGGVTGRAARLLPFSLDPVVEDRAYALDLRLGYRARFVRRSAEPIALMTQRRVLDGFLLEQAAGAGADVRDGVTVADLRPDGLTVDGEEVRARVVIGADGCNGSSARALGLGGDLVHCVALEGNVRATAERLDRYRGRMVFELATVPGGYGWVFAKGGHLNVGVFGWRSEGPRLREHLALLCAEHAIDVGALEQLRGYRLPMAYGASTLARGTAAVVGDAAGLVDPFTGDGIYEAVLSAKLAAEAALDVLRGRAAGLEPYGAALTRQLTPLTSAGWRAKAAFDRFPRVTFAVCRLPVTWRVLEQVVLGRLAHPGEARGLERAAVQGIAALARRATPRQVAASARLAARVGRL
jgi:geranylgeranyl reductase family protein